MWCIKTKRRWEEVVRRDWQYVELSKDGIEVEHKADGNTEVVEEQGLGDRPDEMLARSDVWRGDWNEKGA